MVQDIKGYKIPILFLQEPKAQKPNKLYRYNTVEFSFDFFFFFLSSDD